MRTPNQLALAMYALCLVTMAGCHRQGDANAEMAKAVKALEEVSSPPALSPPPATTPAAASTAPPAESSQRPVTSQPVAQQMSQAMVSYKSGDYEDAIMRLQLLRSRVAKTPEQTMAIQDAVAAVMAELYARAEKGDTRAGQAIKQWQEIRNRP